MKTSKVASYLLVYGFAHALVDAACIVLLLGGIDVRGDLLTYLIIYNLLAFGLQLPFGWMLDRIHQPVLTAVLGLVVLSMAIMLFIHPMAAIILAGIGNALFHVGGGTVSLNLRPGKAAMPGVFVAQGGIGLFAGGLILKLYGFHPGSFALLLLGMGVIVFLIKSPTILYEIKKAKSINYLELTILLLMITICIRSVVGLSVDFPWKSNMTLLIWLTAAIALGKGLGGFLSDYFGWIKIAVGGLAISAILLLFGPQVALAGIAGLFFFNLTMPVTLVAISNLLPGRPGFSFGLTTLAVVAGAMPTFLPTKTILSTSPVIFISIVLSVLTLFFGLKLLQSTSTKTISS
jgi:FSR family fosmidomycin resistance protein-like MFS transporter